MKKKYYPIVNSNICFSDIDKKILKFWKENSVFESSVSKRPRQKNNKNNEFIFYDGPPFANGLPHYGHLLTGFIKDTYARYHTSLGKRVERRFGWDCHGLPAEMSAEKELSLSGRSEIINYGIDKFNSHCRKSVMKYAGKWKEYVEKQARWVDFEGDYKTMDKDFMESVIWAFKTLYDKGLIYEAMRVMPYSWACETSLSNFETRLDNSYRERIDKAVAILFRLKGKNIFSNSNCDTYFMAWTTTPWTLPSNLALAVSPDLNYLHVETEQKAYILAEFAYENYKSLIDQDGKAIKKVIKGKVLEGLLYEPIFDYFKDHKNAFKVLIADFIEEGSGTGIVHTAPGFGEDDQILCEKNNISIICPLNSRGEFTNEVKDYEGRNVFDTNDDIIKTCKIKGRWLKTEQYKHNYPHCWRTDTPLIYKAVPSWYVKVTAFKDKMVKNNEFINWIPSHVKKGLFGKWIENARDWSISRNRFWGTPIPVWKSDDPKYPRIDVYGSIEELNKDFNVKLSDLHRPEIDNLVRINPDDPTKKSKMRRVLDVFDCWFESGSMPYAQVHYPFENKEWFENHFPADFIVEYTAQTRGWFYTLLVLSTALFDRPPFLNCICHGVILDVKGQKLSKRLGNYTDPLEIFEKYGSDALRYTMLSSGVVKGLELFIDKDAKMVYDSLRLNIKPMWNAYHFFTLYANADGIKAEISYESSNILDNYIISKLLIILKLIKNALDAFNTQEAYLNFSSFFDVLNNWYIRRSRNRFWKSQIDNDKIEAYNILYTCLNLMCRASQSLVPIISEEIYLGINTPNNNDKYISEDSVHLATYPEIPGYNIDQDLVKNMDLVREICSTALYLRNENNIRIRQPLKDIKIIHRDFNNINKFSEIIKDELNVKSVEFEENIDGYAEKKIKINFKELGKRIPAEIKNILSEVKNNKWNIDYKDDLYIRGIKLLKTEYEILLSPLAKKDGLKVLPTGEGLIILNLEISEDLKKEGVARDIIRFVQSTRKESGYDISDNIMLEFSSSSYIMDAINENLKMIEEQTLSSIIKIDSPKNSGSFKIGDEEIHYKIK